jgi:hypothetical protein
VVDNNAPERRDAIFRGALPSDNSVQSQFELAAIEAYVWNCEVRRLIGNKYIMVGDATGGYEVMRPSSAASSVNVMGSGRTRQEALDNAVNLPTGDKAGWTLGEWENWLNNRLKDTVWKQHVGSDQKKVTIEQFGLLPGSGWYVKDPNFTNSPRTVHEKIAQAAEWYLQRWLGFAGQSQHPEQDPPKPTYPGERLRYRLPTHIQEILDEDEKEGTFAMNKNWYKQSQLQNIPVEEGQRWIIMEQVLFGGSGGWAPTWTEETPQGRRPLTFATQEEAQKEIDELFEDQLEEVRRGERTEEECDDRLNYEVTPYLPEHYDLWLESQGQ